MLCLFNLLDIYKRILSAFGLQQFEFNDDFNDEKIEEGATLLEKGKCVF